MRIQTTVFPSYGGSSPEAHLARMVFRVMVRVRIRVRFGVRFRVRVRLGHSRVLARCASGLDPPMAQDHTPWSQSFTNRHQLARKNRKYLQNVSRLQKLFQRYKQTLNFAIFQSLHRVISYTTDENTTIS